MARHRHDWRPASGERGQYLCACGASGFRDLLTGAIVAHRIALRGRPAPVTVSDAGHGNRWVERAPTLDDYDRGEV
jgi:hypothetical protein